MTYCKNVFVKEMVLEAGQEFSLHQQRPHFLSLTTSPFCLLLWRDNYVMTVILKISKVSEDIPPSL